jgi:hypothetical protein
METERTYTAFLGMERIVTGDLREMLLRTKEEVDRGRQEPLLIFDDFTGQQVDFDFGGTPDHVLERALPQPTSGRGRPKLGVVSREVSLLPRHWEWLEDQPNGASAALRRLRELIRPWPGDVRDHVDRMVQVSESHAREHHGATSDGA